MEKLNLHSPDFTQANIEKLAELFPNCVTETRAADGALKKAIDFDLLKQELSTALVDGPQERYQLNWPGKREALLTANAPIAKTLRPCREESVDFDTTQNLYIEGDNLDALKLLQETYLGKVKMIYIDPPYNTGNDFIYHDEFNIEKNLFDIQSGVKDEDGYRLIDQDPLSQNSESNGRFHSDWLSMIYPRLKLARNLLGDDGVIFLSIGQDEISSVFHVIKEIFGEKNFLTICSRIMKKGGQKGVHFSPCVDYIIAFAKNIDDLGQFREEIGQNLIDTVYTKVETSGSKKGEKYRSMGLYQAMLDKRANQRFYIQCPDGSFVIPPGKSFPNEQADGIQVTPNDGDGVWRWTYGRYAQEKIAGNVEFIKSNRSSLIKPDGSLAEWNVYYKIWLSDRLQDGQLPGNILEKFESRHSSAELKVLDIPFDFPKPSALIKFLMAISGVKEGEITMDFFSGSCSTGHAAMEFSWEKGSRQPFICIQLPEKTKESSDEYKKGFKNIAEIGKERIRRAGKKIKAENADKASIDHLDIGFRVLKVDNSNMKDVYYTPDKLIQGDLEQFTDNIRDDRTPEDLLFQVLLDWGVDLTLPITQETITGKTVLFVDDNALAACFDTDINEAFVKELAARHPMRVVFRDAGFASDSVKINIEQIFKLISPTTEIKTL